MNLYLDTFSVLKSKYGTCKQGCLQGNPRLIQELKEVEKERDAGQSARYFDPQASDPCLTECRAQFYFVFRKVNEYYVKDRGFYVEQASAMSKYLP